MATINNIRKQKKLLLVVIVLAMLLFLVPYEAIISMVQGNSAAGEINGTSISQEEFRKSLSAREKLGLSYKGENALTNAVWSDVVETHLLEEDYDRLGIMVTDEEFEDITFGDNISSFVSGTFFGQGGVTEEAKTGVRDYFDQMSPSVYEGFKDMIINKRKKEKWDALVKKGFYANPIDAKTDYLLKNEKVSFDYVVKKYSDIDDSEVTISDSDLRTYYNKHKNETKFQQEKVRDIEFVEFIVDASKKDSTVILGEFTNVASEWRTRTDDSSFCAFNQAFFRPMPYVDGTFTAINDTISNANKGTVFGPFLDKGAYTITKVIDVTFGSDSADVRHLLLKNPEGADISIIQTKLDSIQAEIQSGRATFEDMVTKFSEDPGSAAKGGKYEGVTRGQMVPAFNDYSFNQKVGDMGIVETQFGLHLIEVLKQSSPKKIVEVFSLTEKIEPSIKTMKAAYKEASHFANYNNNKEKFTTMADSLNMAIKEANSLKRGNTRIPGISNPAKLTAWIFNATSKEGQISSPILVENKYVIAHLNRIKEKGTAPFDYVKEVIEEEVMKEKKFELYKSKMNSGTLDDVATAIEGAKKTATNINKNTGVVTGSGISTKEPQVVGLAFAIPSGEMSNPIQGEDGIWVIAPTEMTPAAEKEEYVTDQDAVQKTVENKWFQVYSSMRDKAGVDDTRFGN